MVLGEILYLFSRRRPKSIAASKMKTLLTGATGFVGAAVLRRLIEVGHNVPLWFGQTATGAICPGLNAGELPSVFAILSSPGSLSTG